MEDPVELVLPDGQAVHAAPAPELYVPAAQAVRPRQGCALSLFSRCSVAYVHAEQAGFFGPRTGADEGERRAGCRVARVASTRGCARTARAARGAAGAGGGTSSTEGARKAVCNLNAKSANGSARTSQSALTRCMRSRSYLSRRRRSQRCQPCILLRMRRSRSTVRKHAQTLVSTR